VDATARTAIRLEDVSKAYPGGSVAVRSLTLDVPAGEVVALVGPSGCGKSTTLRMINRLVEPTSGHIWFGEEDITTSDRVKLRRRIGYVIQHVGLFPHQTVAANVATVPHLLGWDRTRTTQRVNELLELVGLPPDTYRRRYPHELSGGQRQRVGVARALAADPVVLLMDEPFSAIDPIARARLQEEFLRLQREVRKTVVMVTHDIDEAVRLADRVAVLRDGGVLEQYAEPSTLLGAPASEFVADFVGGDRSLRRLAVTPIDVSDVQPFSAVGAAEPAGVDGLPTVARDSTLKDAFAVLLQHDTGWVAVRDGDRLLGVLTPAALHGTLLRTTPEPSP
jgi:osmoprotectant transport system ATP-binding protein